MADGIHIVIDTREQRPWSFPANIEASVHGLNIGDYALIDDCEFIEKRETARVEFAIERKSAADFAGTIASGWPRFCRELKRMDDAEFPAKVIIVEDNLESFVFRNDQDGKILPPDHEHCRVSPQFVMKRVAELALRGTIVLFAGDADLASAIALKVFIERQGYLSKVEKHRLTQTDTDEHGQNKGNK
jgi:ERCC4-type nuclease